MRAISSQPDYSAKFWNLKWECEGLSLKVEIIDESAVLSTLSPQDISPKIYFSASDLWNQCTLLGAKCHRTGMLNIVSATDGGAAHLSSAIAAGTRKGKGSAQISDPDWGDPSNHNDPDPPVPVDSTPSTQGTCSWPFVLVSRKPRVVDCCMGYSWSANWRRTHNKKA